MHRWCRKFHVYFFIIYVCVSNIYGDYLMKKLYLFFLLACLVEINLSAQEIEPTVYTCGEFISEIDTNQKLLNNPEDSFVDRFGNTHYKKINTNQLGEQRAIPLTPDYVSPESLFAVYLTDQIADNSISDFNNDANYRNVIAQIFADLEQLIIENPASGVIEPVKIELQSIYSSSGNALASASSYYNYNGVVPGTIVDGEVWKAINSGSNDSDAWDGFIKVNFFHQWYSNFENPTGIYGTNSYDMYAVLLHEIMHALGFASGIDQNGNPKNGNAFLTYDTLLHTDTGDNLIVPSGSSWLFNGTLNTNVITNGCPSTSEVRLGDNDLFVHTPQTYSSGSSLSHIDLDNDCVYPVTDYIMAYAVSVETPRRPITQEFDILCSLNYNLATQYGNNNVVNFGNPAVVTTQNNHTSNMVTYASCNPDVFGFDDFTNVATQPTIDNCQGSVLSILEQDLLSNDVSNLGLTLEVSNLSLNGSLITTFTGTAPNRTFLVSPNTVGNLQLVYKPIDTNGNLGNDTFANIVVTICASLNCVNTSSCNLICNPEFIDPTPGNTASYNAFSMSYHMNTNGNGPSELDGWFAFNGSVSYYDFSIPCAGSQCPSLNYFNLPGSTGEGAIALVGCDINQPNNGESLLTNVTISNDVNYLLSVNRNRWLSNRDCSYQVYLSDNNAINSGNPYGGACSGTTDILDGLPFQTIALEENITSNQWEQSLFCFTANDDYQTLILNAYSAAPSTGQSHVLLDNIELIEDKFITNTANIQTTYDLICGQDANLGQPLCLVSSLEYQYWDVSDAANTFQLTNALVTPNYYVSDLNSSEVVLNDIAATVHIELRRVFVNTNGVSININTCNTVLPITINVTPEKPQDGSFTNTEDSIDCLLHTFQASETYANHEWDFNNDGIMDVSGSGDDVANTNPSFTFPGLGTFLVTHTVSNACGSITYQENITINCTTTCTGTSTWDGSSWDNGDPDIDTEVILNGHYDTATYGSFSACSLTVNAGFNLIIDALNYVEVKYSTTIFGDLLVKHTGSFVQIDDSSFFQLQGDGTATIKKITGNSNVNTELSYISSPTTNTTVADLLQNNSLFYGYRYWFNTANFKDSCAETLNNNICVEGTSDGIDDPDPITGYGNDWVYAGNTFVMQPGLGLVVRPNANTSIPLTFTGELNNGVISVPITRNDEDEPLVNSGALNARDDNPIYVGNPYASAISADAFLERNMYNHPGGTNTDGIMDGVILIWSHNTPPSATTNGNQPLNFDFGDYAMINLTGEIEGGEIGLVPNRFIPSGQGIFLDFSNDVISPNGNIIFNNSMRVTGDNNQFFRDSNVPNNKLKLNLSTQTGVHGEILLGYVDGATSNFDGSAYDASEHTPIGQNAIIYFNIPDSHKKFVIQGKSPDDLNNQEIVSVGFFNSILESESLEFKININDFQGAFLANHSVYIQDNLLGVCHNLSASDYSFTSAVGQFNNRFDINFSNCHTLSVSENEIQGLKVYPNPTKSIINVKANTAILALTLYNNLGQVVLEKTEVNHVDVSKMSEGVYFLQIKDSLGNIKNVRIIKQGE